jgi:uncharacterized sporulation protein YeaH/YhbH (DUF444 family)
MSTFIDRRLNPRDKTIKNRQKFLKRYKQQIKEAVKEIIDKSDVADVENNKVKVKVKNIHEPTFSIDRTTGNKSYVLPGNKKYIVGDTSRKPESGSGKAKGSDPSAEGTSQDDFEFILTQEEFAQALFDELELPNLTKKKANSLTFDTPQRAGFKRQGTPSQLALVRSLKKAIGRRIGLRRPSLETVEAMQKAVDDETNPQKKAVLLEELEAMKARQNIVPWIDPFDIQYKNFESRPKQTAKAVMFCVMDISGSMGEREKNIAKRFFIRLHMFLKRKYQQIDVVFVSHHVDAKEVDENEFFHSQESGGTLVSPALALVNDTIKARYDVSDWNVYVAQVSDGDNHPVDEQDVHGEMEKLLPKVQYFAYVEVVSQYSPVYDSIYAATRETELWLAYQHIKDSHPVLNCAKVLNQADIWNVFTKLFAKQAAK